MSAEFFFSEIFNKVKVVLREKIVEFSAGMFREYIPNHSRSSLSKNTGDCA
jgi:hypothetical protein